MYILTYGICWEVDTYNPQLDIQITWGSQGGYTLVSDKDLRIHPSLAFKSQTGDEMLSRWSKDTFKVQIEVTDQNDPVNDKACKDYNAKESYKDCVDEKLKAMLLPKLNCMPPWLSPDNHCIGVYTGNNFATFNSTLNSSDFIRNVIEPILSKDQLAVKSKCLRPCIAS